jgi:hypothetical protein
LQEWRTTMLEAWRWVVSHSVELSESAFIFNCFSTFIQTPQRQPL